MADLVKVVCGDTGPDLGRNDVEHLTSQPADLAHGILASLVEYVKLVAVEEALALGDAGLGVVGALYRLRNLALCRERVDGTERAGVIVSGERVEVAGGWVGFRNGLWSNEAGENTVCELALGGLVAGLVIILKRAGSSVQGRATNSAPRRGTYPVSL